MATGMNSNEMQKNNRTLVFKTLSESGSMTRTELAAEIGLQKATITNIVNEFLEMGIIAIDGDGAAGRRGENIYLKLDEIYTMSVGITRKDYQIGIFSLNGKQVSHVRYQFEKKEDFHQIVDKLKASALELEEQFGKDNIIGICLAVPGPYIRRDADVNGMFRVSRFEELSRVDLRRELEETLGQPVMIKHDAKLSAYAEWKNAQEARENRHASLMIIRSRGFGIGAGIVINGKIVEGQFGIAGEIGHMGINYNGRRIQNEISGTFEYCAGTESAVRYMLERLYEFPDSILNENSTYMEIVDAYRKKDALAVYAIEKMAWMLGYGIANIVYIINPDCIILGQDYPDMDCFIDKVRQVVEEFVQPVARDGISIRYTRLHEDSFLLGGYYYVLETLYKENLILEKVRLVMESKKESPGKQSVNI